MSHRGAYLAKCSFLSIFRVQVCTSTSRIYAHEAIYDRFLERFVQVTKENDKLGNPFSAEALQGPQVSKPQFDKILSYIEQGKSSGARLLYGGTKQGAQGYFIQPTVFADVSRQLC
jgi:aldehyde dehydrogenase (NAD(P)+)